MKEKEKLQRCLELMAVIEEEVGEARKELNNIWFNLSKQPTKKDWKRFTEEVRQIVPPLFELLQLLGYSFNSEQEAQQFLREIEKEIEKHKRKAKKADEEYDWEARNGELGIVYGLEIARGKIKKAFSRVIPKESEVGSRKTQCLSDYYEMAGSPHSREKLLRD